jgi:HEAT repeat protein
MRNTRRIFILAATAALFAALAAPTAFAADRQAEAAKLVGVLQSNASDFDKAKACQQLAIAGNKDSVPALAALLTNEALAHYARFGLEAIPDPSVDDALRATLGKVKGKLLVGVIDSIGKRQDVKAVEPLGALLDDAEAGVASAAAAALGQIGNAPAAALLTQAFEKKPAASAAMVDACLACGERLVAQGNRAEAAALYGLLWKTDLVKYQRIAALRGLVFAKQADGIPLVVEQLNNADWAFFHAALRLARELTGEGVTPALVQQLDKVPADRKALLVTAIGDRRDPAALPAILEAAKTGSANVRLAAVKTLRHFGDMSAMPVLFGAACDPNVELAQVARAILTDRRTAEVDASVVAMLGQDDVKARLTAIDMAGQWQIASAVDALLKAADDSNEAVQLAALKALGRTVNLEQLPLVIRRIVAGKSEKETAAAIEAVKAANMRMPDRNASAQKLIDAMPQASVPAKRVLFGLLSSLGGSKALEAVAAGTKAEQPEIRETAVALLGKWKTPDAAAALLEVAKGSAGADFQVGALRGYIRIARQFNLPADQKLAMFRESMKLASRDEERKLALVVLTRIPSPETLKIALSYLDQASLKDTACEVGVKIGEKIVETQPGPAVEGMNQLLKIGLKKELANRAKVVIDRSKKPAAK